MLVILFPFTRPSTTTIATLSPPSIQVDPDSVETYTAQRGCGSEKMYSYRMSYRYRTKQSRVSPLSCLFFFRFQGLSLAFADVSNDLEK